MAKKTKEELATERKKKQAEKEAKDRQEEIDFEKELLTLSNSKSDYLERRRLYSTVVSELNGYYDEIDKLTKKSPADTITELQLNLANDLIEMTKKLIKDDEFIEKVKKFVSAGDNPAYRDVIIVLRQLKQGLTRFSDSLSLEGKKIVELAKELLEDEDLETVNDFNLKEIYDKGAFIDPSIYEALK